MSNTPADEKKKLPVLSPTCRDCSERRNLVSRLESVTRIQPPPDIVAGYASWAKTVEEERAKYERAVAADHLYKMPADLHHAITMKLKYSEVIADYISGRKKR